MNQQINEIKINHYMIQPDIIIAKGGFGTIYLGHHYRTKEPVAIKMEHHTNTTLRHETRMLQYLHENGVRKIPAVYWFGLQQTYQVLILPFFPCSLEKYIQHKSPLSSMYVTAIIIKCLDILEHIHAKFVVHRDIKPANFMIKNGDIYLIDFGLATFFVDENSHLLADYSLVGEDVGSMIGTVKYASLNIHRGHRYTRRDDLVSLVYMYDSMKGGGPTMPTESFQIGTGERADILNPVNQQWMYNKEQYLLALEATSDNVLFDIYKFVYYIKYNETPDYTKIKLLLQR